MNRVLVTGGAGFIGSHTVEALLARGYSVRILDNLEPQVHGPLPDLSLPAFRQAEFHRGDLRDPAVLREALEGIDTIVHDAAVVGIAQSQYQIDRYVAANAGGTGLLLDLLATGKHGVTQLMVASSMSLYGEGLYRRPSDGSAVVVPSRRDDQLSDGDFDIRDPNTGENLEPAPTPEDKPLECASIYALTKKFQEEFALLFGRIYGVRVFACRYFNVYGPRQSLRNPYTGVAAIFSSRIKNGNPPLIYEDGRQTRDFIHVRDLVEGKLRLLEDDRATPGVYNIATGIGTAVVDMATRLCALYGRSDLAPEVTGRFRSGDIRHCIGDPGKLAALGWSPRVALDEGLRELVEWGEQAHAVDKVQDAHHELVERGLVGR